MDTFQLLKNLTEAVGPSGLEQEIAVAVRQVWEPFVDDIQIDRIGSLVATRYGSGSEPRRRVLLAAHMDEIALMVTQLVGYPEGREDAAGFLRVSSVGGVDRRHLLGQLVTVHGQEPLRGVLGALPDRMLKESRQGKAHHYDDLVVDTGMSLAELQQVVSVGDFVSFHQPLRRLMNGQVAGKALDNRTSVAAVAICLDYLKDRRHEWDVVAVATAQEETRLLGAYTSAYAIRPDLAIALDVTFGKGPGSKDNGLTFDLDSGPTLGLGPNIHPGVYRRLHETAKEMELKVNTEPQPRYSGTDAIGLQVAREGIPTGLIGLPLRYMHTMVETIALKDIERAGRLLGEFIARLDDSFLDKIAQEMMEQT